MSEPQSPPARRPAPYRSRRTRPSDSAQESRVTENAKTVTGYVSDQLCCCSAYRMSDCERARHDHPRQGLSVDRHDWSQRSATIMNHPRQSSPNRRTNRYRSEHTHSVRIVKRVQVNHGIMPSSTDRRSPGVSKAAVRFLPRCLRQQLKITYTSISGFERPFSAILPMRKVVSTLRIGASLPANDMRTCHRPLHSCLATQRRTIMSTPVRFRITAAVLLLVVLVTIVRT